MDVKNHYGRGRNSIENFIRISNERDDPNAGATIDLLGAPQPPADALYYGAKCASKETDIVG